jgi:hypothetical protein
MANLLVDPTPYNLCSDQALYNSRTVPPGFTLRGIFAPGAGSSIQGQHQTQVPSLFKPIIIHTSALFANQEEGHTPSGKEIVPWKPTGAALALQLFAVSMEQLSTDDQDQQGSHQSSANTLRHGFEFEAQTSRPNQITRVYKRCPKPKKTTLSLPTTASISNPTMLVVDMVSRRSQRLSVKKAGFSYRLDKNPSKKRKITALQISSTDGEEGPVAIATLQSWGIQCGVDPGDLTEEALMQAPTEGNHP